MADPPTEHLHTERIVFLIDLHPIVHLQNPRPYLASILATARTLLISPPLSASLFAFKLFFSSHSPLLSSSFVDRLLGKPSATHISFNKPSETLDALSRTLDSLRTCTIYTDLATSPPRASHVAGSLLQLVHDYAWEQQSENLSGTSSNFPTVRSNLVLLLFPAGRSLKCVSEFMYVDIDHELLTNVDLFCKNFYDIFGAVNDSYVNRDIHCSWIDVKFDVEPSEEKAEIEEYALQLGFLKKGIRSIGWGFCSTDSIVLGSSLIPFELIYPIIAISLNCFCCNNFCNPIRAQLTLVVSDVRGKPLECKCCDLELLNLKKPHRFMPADIMRTLEFSYSESEALEQDKRLWCHFGDGITKLHIKALRISNKDVRIEGCSSNLLLVRGQSEELEKSRQNFCSSFFADRVLEMLSIEMGEFIRIKPIPIWQILLSFLCRKGYKALVSLSNGNGDSFMGILKPLTVHLALLSITNDGQVMDAEFHGKCVDIDSQICKPHSVMNSSNGFVGSPSGTLSAINNVLVGDQNRKRNKKIVYQDFTWISFRKAAFECSELELEAAYFDSKFNDSKKLKFLKCWMKQIKKTSFGCLIVPDQSKSCQQIKGEINESLTRTYQESEQPVRAYFSTGKSEVQEGDALVSCSQTSEDFFCILPKKIQDGLDSKGVDLQILAERLVKLSSYWLYQKNEADNNMESKTPTAKFNASNSKVVASNLIKLLLKDPKELKEKNKNNGTLFPASDLGATNLVSENIVREHELQILFRMEILRSEIGESIQASTKRKLVKQICLLLEIVQYLVEGGFHGHLSLYDYVEKTIKTRYSHVLGTVVNKIYAQMDLLPCGEENESIILLLNSEDSNHSWRDKDRAETKRNHESTSAEDESSQPWEHDAGGPQDVKRDEHAHKLSEAQKTRERARRFGSFTTWAPDLQRVWAPKHPKAVASKSESLQKQSKRKRRHRGSHDVVCETPMIEKNYNGNNTSISVSKALFQDDC